MKTVLGIGSSFSMFASACGISCACSERPQTMKNAKIADGVIDALDMSETHRLQGGCGVVVFIFCRTVFVLLLEAGNLTSALGEGDRPGIIAGSDWLSMPCFGDGKGHRVAETVTERRTSWMALAVRFGWFNTVGSFELEEIPPSGEAVSRQTVKRTHRVAAEGAGKGFKWMVATDRRVEPPDPEGSWRFTSPARRRDADRRMLPPLATYRVARTSWMMIWRVVRPRKVLRSMVKATSQGGSGRATSPPPKKTASCSA